MASQVFYRKWRPQALAEVVGQEHVTGTLLQALKTGRISHAYLFSGPRGTGKTSTGRILAKAVNCLSNGKGDPCNQCSLCQAITQGSSLDVVEIDAASNRGIDEIRSLREKVGFAPGQARYKVYIVDEVHMLTEPAANALLKTLEEPPPHVIFILATTDPYRVPATILSRCQRYDFHRLSLGAVVSRLEYVCQKEGIQVPSQALKLIARSATGSLRDAENTLEQMVAYYGPNLELHQVRELLGLGGDLRARELVRHLLARDLSAGLATINQANADGLDLRQFLREVVEYLRQLLLIKAGSPGAIEVTPEDLEEMKGLASPASLEEILRAAKTFSGVGLSLEDYSSLPLEMALTECLLAGEEKREPRPSAEKSRIPAVARPPVERSETPAAAARTSAERRETPGAVKPPPRPAQKEVAPPPKEPPVSATAKEISIPALADAEPIEHLRRHWREFIASLKGEGSTGTLDALLRNACEPVAVEGETLVLGFYYPYHKEKIEDPKYCYLIERRLNQVFGASYKLRCVMVEKKRKSPGHLVNAALEQGARIIGGEER